MTKTIRRFLRGIPSSGLAVAAMLAGPSLAKAHEIPASVTVQAYIRAEGDVLRMLIRVPLGSMRDIQFPLRGLGYLNIGEADPYLRDAAVLWLADYLQLFENDERLRDVDIIATRVSLPSDRSFVSFDSAVAHILSPPLPESTDIVWQQAMMDVVLDYAIESDESRFSIFSELAHLGMTTTTILRFDLPGSEERLYQFTGNPGLVELDPRWYQAALQFVELGFLHILDGIDHLLFLLCLVIPFRRIIPLITLVTSFTVAHSITLGASAFGYAPSALWFPPLVETLIALSIVFMAFENIVGAKATVAMAGGVRLRAGPRVRVLLRAPRVPAVCGGSPCDLAPLLQCGRRAGPDRGARGGRTRARAALQAPDAGEDGGDPPLGHHRAHLVALDGGPLAEPPRIRLSVAHLRHRLPSHADALGDGNSGSGRGRVDHARSLWQDRGGRGRRRLRGPGGVIDNRTTGESS